MRFRRDRAVRHSAGAEADDDLFYGFDFFDRNRVTVEFEVEQTSQSAHAHRVVIRRFRVFIKTLPTIVAHRVLKLRHRLGIKRVLLAAETPLIETTRIKLGILELILWEATVVPHFDFAREYVDSDALNTRVRTGECEVHDIFPEADGLEDLCTAVTLKRRNPHFREDLEQAKINGVQVILDRRFDV